MSKYTILKPHEFDASQFVYTAVKPNSYGGKAAFINYEKHNVRIETPKMLCKWGIATYPPNDPNPTSYSMQIEFPRDMDEKMKQFHDNMELLDKTTMLTAMERSKDWLGKPSLTEESAKEFYTPILIKHLDEKGVPTGKYADSIRLKLPLNKDGRFSVKCFNHLKEPVELKDAIQKGSYVKAIIELNGVSLKKNAYSLSCKALQLQVYPATRFTGYSFLPDEDDDESVIVTTTMPTAEMSECSMVENNDENEADEQSPTMMEMDESSVAMTEEVVMEPTLTSSATTANTTTTSAPDEVVVVNSDEEPVPEEQPKKRTKFTKKK